MKLGAARPGCAVNQIYLCVARRHGQTYPASLFSVPAGIGRKLFSISTRRDRDSISYKRYAMPQAGTSINGSRERKGKRTAYIALGSNLGDRISWIERACNEMDARGIKVTRTSSLYETEPMYVLDQDSFVNGACEVSPITFQSSTTGPAVFSNPNVTQRSRQTWSLLRS